MTLHPNPSRRDLLGAGVYGIAGWGLLSAVARAGLSPRAAVAKAKHCIYLFMSGGPSQMDLFDYKPELQRQDGKTVVLERRRGDEAEAKILGSKRSFRQYGETGQWCCDLLPHLSKHMDRLAVVKSLTTDSFAHGSGLQQMNTGQILAGHPSMGSWISYGLGSENENLPTFVVMQDPRGGPISGAANWSSGYIPASHQGTLFRAVGDAVLDLNPTSAPLSRARMTREMQAQQVRVLRELNDLHAAERPEQSDLEARSRTYELAHRMRDTAPEALDLSREDERTRALYGLDLPRGDHPLTIGPRHFGRQCLIARRLIERGVRFVQIYHGGGHQQQTWDAHKDVEENLAIHCPEVDVPIAGLLTDLDQRGLLDETLVIWGGEFGRMPTSQGAVEFQTASSVGRDHNPKAVTMWLAGAGVRPGPYGETDEIGAAAAVDVHHLRDMHATILHLMGLDHETLTYRYGGLDRKLTGVIEAHPIRGIMA